MERSTRGIDYQDVPRPIAGLATLYPAGFVDPLHSHPRGQLSYHESGVSVVTTRDASFVIPPGKAMWVPAGVEHEVTCRSPVAATVLYVRGDARPDLPAQCRMIPVSRLMAGLIGEASQVPVDYDVGGRDGRVMALLLDEIGPTAAPSISAPMPRSRALAQVCSAILRDPAANDDLDDWAEAAGMGRRTFTRQFRRETGVSFAAWRQNVRLMEALSLLSAGQSVTSVAFDVGYNSPSAFTAMFRRAFGVAPTAYLSPRLDS
ncbi:MAG: helix-turn-helix transcriptional regulator [Caulobacteraceae bacterium]|nr:helix-turn-helix transcriptional regulator [Caulobacteraceae bacterium]